MAQDINYKAEKVNGKHKQKVKVAFDVLLTVVYLVLVIYLVFKPLTEFAVMIDYYIMSNIMNYVIK